MSEYVMPDMPGRSLREVRQTMSRHLKVGKEYILKVKIMDGMRTKTACKKYTCIGLYPNYALFRCGDRAPESFLYQDLYQMMVRKGAGDETD